MKALVIADRAPEASLRTVIEQNNIDILITLGDLTYSDLAELEYITTIPKIGVYGNHCMGTYMEPLGIANAHLKVYEWNGLKIGGFEGCVRYKENPEAIMYTQEQAVTMLQGFPKVDIFLSHAPPFGINDEPGDPSHEGFRALRTYLDEQQPGLWLHGHTYPTEDQLVRQHNNTRIEYVYRQRIVEF